MAGRGGRGRGRGKGISFNVESLGFGRGEALPMTILQPPPTFPIAQFKPVPLESSEEQNYLLALKEELRTAMKESVYVIKPMEKKKEIERYSDKYQGCNQSDRDWQPDWSRLPAELHPKRKRTAAALKAKKSKAALEDINRQFELLAEQEDKGLDEGGVEQEDTEETEDPKKAKTDEQENEEELDIYDEDDLEEETDYNMTYFDNGENDDDDDDLDEGPIY